MEKRELRQSKRDSMGERVKNRERTEEERREVNERGR